MQHSTRPLLPIAFAALLGLAPLALSSSAAAQENGRGHGQAKAKGKGHKDFDRDDEARADRPTLRQRAHRDDDENDDRDTDRQQPRRRSDLRVPPGQMPPAGMCRIWIDGVPPGRQPAATDCATAERNRPSNARVLYGSEARGTVSREPLATRTVVRRDASCADVNGDGRRERVLYLVNGRVVRAECR